MLHMRNTPHNHNPERGVTPPSRGTNRFVLFVCACVVCGCNRDNAVTDLCHGNGLGRSDTAMALCIVFFLL